MLGYIFKLKNQIVKPYIHIRHYLGGGYLEKYLEGYKYKCLQQLSPDGMLMNNFSFHLFLVFL